MARPITERRIAGTLRGRSFRPDDVPRSQLDHAHLTLDGLEALRLADIEGLYQEEAARRMGVSRATFARVLGAAREVVADVLVNGKALEIGGGEVEERPDVSWPCPIHGGRRRKGRGCRCGEESPPGAGRGGSRRRRVEQEEHEDPTLGEETSE